MTDHKLHAGRLVVQGQAPDEVRTFTAPSGATINLITPAAKPAISSDLDLVAKGLSKDLARKVCRDAGGRAVGKRVLVPTDKLEAYLSAAATETRLASLAPAPKTTLKKGASTDDIAKANGLRVVKGGDQ